MTQDSGSPRRHVVFAGVRDEAEPAFYICSDKHVRYSSVSGEDPKTCLRHPPLLQCALKMRMSCEVGDLNSRFGYGEPGQQALRREGRTREGPAAAASCRSFTTVGRRSIYRTVAPFARGAIDRFFRLNASQHLLDWDPQDGRWSADFASILVDEPDVARRRFRWAVLGIWAFAGGLSTSLAPRQITKKT
jgi:hypothetical protein